ncbi:hypothetical protein [Actinoplanes couchii]|nr:hypothetical protein [Actinoplanes couchii]MDR6325264.1 hypothetical protein [Actinoplanes couchii]
MLAEDQQKQLVADCVRLWEAGELKLKPIAAHYRSVVADIAAAEAGIGALWRDQSLGGPYGEARSAWLFLADTTVAILRDTADNLEACGDVLIMASGEYQEAERINTEAIASAKDRAVRARAKTTTVSTSPVGGEMP